MKFTTFESFLQQSSFQQMNEARDQVIFDSPRSGKIRFNDMEFTFWLPIASSPSIKQIGTWASEFHGVRIKNSNDKVIYDNNGEKCPMTRNGIIAIRYINDKGNEMLGMPVPLDDAINYFDGKYKEMLPLKELSKIQKEIGNDKAKKIISKEILNIMRRIITKSTIEGSLFLDVSQQKEKKKYLMKVKDLGLNIDIETRSVIEFSGSLYDEDSLNKIVNSLNNSSYFIKL